MTECKKVKYSSQEFAEQDVIRIKQISKRKKIPIRSYLCICGSWHLTSRVDHKDLIIDALNLKITSLTLQLEYYVRENYNLSKMPKPDNTAIRTDERIAELNKRLGKQGELMKKLKDKNEELIMKIIKLQPEEIKT